MLLERDAELGRALLELVARHLPGEALVLHLLRDRADVDLVEAPVRPNVGDGDDEPAHLVAGVDGLREQARARQSLSRFERRRRRPALRPVDHDPRRPAPERSLDELTDLAAQWDG